MLNTRFDYDSLVQLHLLNPFVNVCVCAFPLLLFMEVKALIGVGSFLLLRPNEWDAAYVLLLFVGGWGGRGLARPGSAWEL